MKRATKKQAPAAPKPRPFLGEWKCAGFVTDMTSNASSFTMNCAIGFSAFMENDAHLFHGCKLPLPTELRGIIGAAKLEITVKAFV